MGSDLKKGLLHGLGLAALLSQFAPVWAAVSGTAGLWFPALSVVTGPLASELPVIPEPLANQVFLGGAVLYLAVLGDKLLDRFTEAQS